MQQSSNDTMKYLREIQQGNRFGFGENWSKFLSKLDDTRILHSVNALDGFLGREEIRNKSFLDIGSGSGLSSLAAIHLGAKKVRSFDFDLKSVECNKALKSQFGEKAEWEISQGSILNNDFLETLEKFDIVYSWGVLHHTGRMWPAIDNAIKQIAPNGLLMISIYNDQGSWSKIWTRIKKIYNRLPFVLQTPYAAMVMFPREIRLFLIACLRGEGIEYWKQWFTSLERGMSRWHDIIDWVGGYPFEVAKPEDILDFCRQRNLELLKLKTNGGGLGCNEYLFRLKPQQ